MDSFEEQARAAERRIAVPFFATAALMLAAGILVSPAAAGVVAGLYLAYCAIAYR